MLSLALIAAASTPALSPHGVREAVRVERRRIVSSRAEGVSDPRTARAATADDPARIASISKLAVSLAVLRLVGQGKLDLDRDVSQLLGWRLRNPAFPDTPITLRLLLSHRSGLTDAADYAIPLGETVRERLSRPGAWDTTRKPGNYFRYANLNFPVIASVMEAATGTRFDRLMSNTLFGPAKIEACFNWQGCSDAMIARAVVLRDTSGAVVRDDLQGKPPPCPVVPRADGGCDLAAYRPGENGALFSPQGGMRISAEGLARIGQLIANRRALGRLGIDAKELSTPLWRYDGSNGDSEGGIYCAFGLSVHFLGLNKHPGCRDDLFGDGRRRMGHSGEAYGLRSGLWVEMRSERGVAYFETALPDDPPKGRSAFTAAEEAMARGK